MDPRIVIVTRPSPYEELIHAHGTHGQAAWFLSGRGQAIEPLVAIHEAQDRAVDAIGRAIPSTWRRAKIGRADLDRFLFEPEDLVVAIGQDGLVANVAKYLDGQWVLGVDPGGRGGVLARHTPEFAAKRLVSVADRSAKPEIRTMIEAVTDDGQRLRALNEIFAGHRTHQSAKYTIDWGGANERHSSSGLLCATGTGCTGWALSVARSRRTALDLPGPDAPELVFFAREPWPSPQTGTALAEGLVRDGTELVLTSEMNDNGVLFGDGIEADAVAWPFARTVRLRKAAVALHLVQPA